MYCLPAEGIGWSGQKYAALDIGSTAEVLWNVCIWIKIFAEDVNTILPISPERLSAEYYRNHDYLASGCCPDKNGETVFICGTRLANTIPFLSHKIRISVLSCYSPRREKITGGYHNYPLKGLNLRYTYCSQKQFSE